MPHNNPELAGENSRKRSRRAGQVCERCHEKKYGVDMPSRRGKKKRPLSPNEGVEQEVMRPLGPSSAETESILPSTNNADPKAPLIQQPSPLLSLQSALESQESTQSALGIWPNDQNEKVQEYRQHQTFLGNTGYMQMFSNERPGEDEVPPKPLPLVCEPISYPISEDLLDIYLEIYFEYANVWCPVLDWAILDSHPQILGSPFFHNALALCAIRLRPPLIGPTYPEEHYLRAKSLFYGNCESNPLIQIISIMLFYWWSPGRPNVASLDTGRWWVGTAIRLAEEIGLHHDKGPAESYIGETSGLKRRIWWTLFARDRIVALAQGRPCFINPEYCSVPMVTVHDFPDPADLKASIFVHWVRMWEIVGRIHKEMYQSKDSFSPKPTFVPEMIDWVQSLPASLQLPFSSRRTVDYNRDVHDLHLGYLTTITLLYLNKSDESVPTAQIPAIAAASCIARIFKDFLARGSVRFLLTQATWSIALAILALIHARRIDGLAHHAEEDIRVLRTALAQLAPLSYPGKMFCQGIERILDQDHAATGAQACPAPDAGNVSQECWQPVASASPIDIDEQWTEFFPYVATDTSPLIANLLASHGTLSTFAEPDWPADILPLLNEVFADSHMLLAGHF
ncbi:uncharacterized protein N7498_004475 [Penicillium cinerascens]|uniref:Xylanolytic transcriptional activator regulatory domain-containing protein n=1 Tax=Penicillium cinerascens TaxID=70096 RepID=A0A9W9N4X6_9EURO|nr:uncharacterized protein N7498_004475 [Penicillium cinerascens]KAJ5212829.1 hypothetical protein N7498_004475 [Penicillium cinerascens]